MSGATSHGRSIHLNVGHDDFCKRLKDPQESGIFHLEALLPFHEAVKLERGNANVRPPADKKPLKAMMDTVDGEPQTFHLKNRGITYLCDRFEYDNSKKIITVTIPQVTELDVDEDSDEVRFGIADGGHTYEVISRTIKKLPEYQATEGWREPYVRVRFISGHTSDLAPAEQIVEALNTSLQVQAYTLDEYQGQFEELKQALTKAGFNVGLIAFRENEEREWHVLEIIQRLACFLKDRWSRTQPASMYKSKTKALELYVSDATRGEFRRLFDPDVIREVITFPEYIESQFSTAGCIDRRSFGRLKAVKALKKEEERPGTGYKRAHRMDLAAVLPMAAAFRELLGTREDRYFWKVDPKAVFQRCAEDLYQVLVTRSRKVKAVSHLGADMEYWGACVPIVMRTKDLVQEETLTLRR